MLSWKNRAGLEWSCRSLWSCRSCVIRYWMFLPILNCYTDLTRSCRYWVVIQILNCHAWLEWSSHLVLILIIMKMQPGSCILIKKQWWKQCNASTLATLAIIVANSLRVVLYVCAGACQCKCSVHISALSCSMQSFESVYVASAFNMCISRSLTMIFLISCNCRLKDYFWRMLCNNLAISFLWSRSCRHGIRYDRKSFRSQIHSSRHRTHGSTCSAQTQAQIIALKPNLVHAPKPLLVHQPLLMWKFVRAKNILDIPNKKMKGFSAGSPDLILHAWSIPQQVLVHKAILPPNS